MAVQTFQWATFLCMMEMPLRQGRLALRWISPEGRCYPLDLAGRLVRRPLAGAAPGATGHLLVRAPAGICWPLAGAAAWRLCAGRRSGFLFPSLAIYEGNR